jgi:hypothetical protein
VYASRYNRITAWVALAALLLGVATTSHSGWRVQPHDGLPVDLCSASGVAPGPGQGGSGAPAPPESPHDDHCWFCGKTGMATALLERRPAAVFDVTASAPPLHAPIVSAGLPPHLLPPSHAPPRLL